MSRYYEYCAIGLSSRFCARPNPKVEDILAVQLAGIPGINIGALVLYIIVGSNGSGLVMV